MSTKMEWIIALKAEIPSRESLDRVEDGKLILSGLAPDTKLILTYIYTFANPLPGSGSICAWPTISRLADETGKSRETIRKHLERAEALGWLRGESWGHEDNPLRRWHLEIPEKRNPRKKRVVREVDHPAHPVATGDEEFARGGQPLVTPAQPVVTEKFIEKVIEKEEEKQAATHTREGERTHEASQPAAAKGQDLNLDHERQTANKPAVDAAHDEASPELVQMLGTLLASRMASLVRKPDAVTPAMIRPTLRTLKRWAAGDEGKVKEYLLDELDRQEGRDAHERAAHPGVLLKWLADRKSWNRWLAAAASATPATPDYSPNRDKSIPVGRPPRPGMKWNSVIGDWTNSCAIHTGLLANLPGSDADDEVTR
jgi:hypothetical protein